MWGGQSPESPEEGAPVYTVGDGSRVRPNDEEGAVGVYQHCIKRQRGFAVL